MSRQSDRRKAGTSRSDEQDRARQREIAEASESGRRADRKIATALGRPGPVGEPVGSGQLSKRLAGGRELSPERESRLVRAAQDGDRSARGKLVEAFLPMIDAAARHYRGSPQVEPAELIQEGVVGLLRALERFDPDRGTPFWGYAVWWVRQAMQQLVSELTRPFVLSDRALRQLARVRDSHAELLQESGHEPASSDLADRAGLSQDQLADLMAADRTPRSIEESGPGSEGLVGSLGELLVDPLAEGEYELVLESLRAEGVLALLSGLSDRERSILRDRFGLEGRPELSLEEVAAGLGISAERVRQIQERALGKLAAVSGERSDATAD